MGRKSAVERAVARPPQNSDGLALASGRACIVCGLMC
jgi:hypothetical protein